MTDLQAIMMIEGADSVEGIEAEIAAWQHLINTGTVWKLQGFYGRTATHLIDAGLCKKPETA